MSFPDAIITNANVITMNDNQPRAGAVAMKGQRILAVGSDAEIASLAGPETVQVDLQGRTLTPGFVEPHSHLLLMAMLLAPQVIDVRSFTCPTWQDVVAAAKQAIATTAVGQPIALFGLDAIVQQHAMPSRQELDDLTTAHPLVLFSLSAHTLSANSAALRYVGITEDTPDPAGGKFGRDASGALNGIVQEATAVSLIAEPILNSLGIDYFASVHYQAHVLAEAGFTTIGELLVQAGDMPVLAAIKSARDLPIRMRWYEGTTASLTPIGAAGDTDPLIRQVGLKLWVDGSPIEGKSLHTQPFLDNQVTRSLGMPAGCCGAANYTEEQLLATVRAYAATGLQFACHVEGDAAIDRILNVYETVLTERNMIGTDHRWRLEHCGAATRQQFARATQLGVTCSMFVRHFYYFGDLLMDVFLGPDRGAVWMPLHSSLAEGNRLSLHHDGYFTPPLPIGNLATATTRRTISGRQAGESECIDIDQALRAITINAAYHLMSDHEIGSIEVGKFADFTELSTDPYTVASDQLEAEVKVLGTWLNGQRIARQ